MDIIPGISQTTQLLEPTVEVADPMLKFLSAIDSETDNESDDKKDFDQSGSSFPESGRLLQEPEQEAFCSSEEEDSSDDLSNIAGKCYEQASELGHKLKDAAWKVVHHQSLPDWMKDNDYLVRGHRPQLNSFNTCFYSVFRMHTETGNIWTHLLGCVAFIAIAGFFLTRDSLEVQWQEKAVFSTFFAGAILCLGFSTLFHTVCCHSERMSKLFNKLDYCGIALLTMGSFVPWLYYSFYCQLAPKVAYLTLISVLGTTCIVVSLWDKFAKPHFRPVRAALFIGLGLSGVIPATHFVIQAGFWKAVNEASLGWLVLMAVLYIVGAVIYAVRFPERFFPGRFDIWCQSHQIFHIFVLIAAFVHYHGITEIANYRLTYGDCFPDAQDI